jgi:hypothetical protein
MSQDNIKEKYRIVFDKLDPKKWCVELLPPCDPFHGILLSYGEFTIKEPSEENAEPKFSFSTELIYVPDRLNGVTLPDEDEEKMQNLLANILLDIIDSNLNKTKSENGKIFLELVKEEDAK